MYGAGVAERHERALLVVRRGGFARTQIDQLARRRRLYAHLDFLRRRRRTPAPRLVAMPVTEADIHALYLEYGYFLFRRCLAFMGDEETAHDALQEVFVRALQGAADFRGDAAAKTWLCRITDHHCIDLLRRRKSRGETGGASLADGEEGDGEGPLERIVHNDDPESLLTARRLMASLDPEARRMAILYFVDELTQDEMAAELGLSRRTIGKHLKKLIAQAKALLEERKQAI
jgi:RNA polymerase sigma-70 factor (ECF subfamily)